MGWINTIANGISNAFKSVRPALPAIPPILLLCEVAQRPGLSAIALASAIISRLPEAGIQTGTNPDGSPNKILQLIIKSCEEVVTEIKDNCKVTCALGGSAVSSVGNGANAGGPITVVSQNIAPMTIDGIAQ